MLIIFLWVLPREGARASFTPGERKKEVVDNGQQLPAYLLYTLNEL